MAVLHVTAPDDETGLVVAITDRACICGWPETQLRLWPDRPTTRYCPQCEQETDEP